MVAEPVYDAALYEIIAILSTEFGIFFPSVDTLVEGNDKWLNL
jgi:hypothetical protein